MKRLVSLCLVFTLVMTLIPMNILAVDESTTKFSDVAATDYYASAATALEQLDILAGYPDGSFGAEKPITRAEMAAVVCRMIDKEAESKKASGATHFSDVSANHWASGYINVASKEGIINGDGNGKFRPEDNVKHEEAIKMVVCALGYGNDVVLNPNDWSQGYLEIAAARGISDGLRGTKGKASTRGDVAVMTYNGLATGKEDAKIPAAPIASLAAGEYKGSQKIKLTTTTKDADIYYTTDGTEPSVKSTKYVKEISLSKTSTLKAIAVKNGVLSKGMLRVDYTIKQPSGGGGGGFSGGSSYRVSFKLNYENAPAGPSSQSIAKGATATEPEDPERDLFVFAGWFVDRACTEEYDFSTPVTRAVTLYAGWYSALYGIHDITMEDGSNVVAAVSTDGACDLRVRFLDTETAEILGEKRYSLTEGLDNVSTTVEASDVLLPQYFLIEADLLDEAGKKLCKTHTCIDYTPEYEAFMAKTTADFEAEDVVNFDESESNNFAVLNDGVERISVTDEAMPLSEGAASSVNILNEETSDFENNYFEIANISDDLADTQVGDILFLEYGDGYIITVSRFEITEDNVLKVWGTQSSDLKDYFDFIKVDMELNPDDYEEVTLPEYSEDEVELMAEIVDVETEFLTTKFSIPIELSCSNAAKTRTGKFEASVSLELKPKLVIKWDAHLFSEDYFEFKLSTEVTTGINASLIYSRTNGTSEEEVTQDEMLEKVANIPLGKVLIPFGVTGLNAKVELTVPVSVEFKCSANFTSTTTTSAFVSYDTVNGVDNGKETSHTKSFTVEGEIEIKIGPKLEESIEFLGGVLKASLEQHGGLYLDIKAEWNIANSDHLCDVCASGEFGLFLNVSAKISYKITDHFKGTPINATLYDAKWKIIDCHVSSISGFGWGECPNVSTNWDGQCTLNGKITVADRDMDNSNNAPLKDALVSIKKNDSNKTASVLTGNNGTYTIENVPAGEYTITISKQGYITVSQTISIVEAETNHYNAVIEAVAEEDDGVGRASGKITDAVTGAGVSGLKLVIRKGLNNLVGTIEQEKVTGNNGSYTTGDLNAGNYTVQIVDNRTLENEDARYYPASFNIKILGNCTISDQNGVVTNGLTVDQLRIVLRWGATPSDLDSHLVGPTGYGGRFHVYYSDKNHSESGERMADLDLDDTSSYGPETTTIYVPVSGNYTFLVHDYSNRSSTGSTALSGSGAYVEVYLSDSQSASMTYYVPEGVGTLWTVFRYNAETGTIEPINTLSNHSSPSSVGGSMYSLRRGDSIEEDINFVLENIAAGNKE